MVGATSITRNIGLSCVIMYDVRATYIIYMIIDYYKLVYHRVIVKHKHIKPRLTYADNQRLILTKMLTK